MVRVTNDTVTPPLTMTNALRVSFIVTLAVHRHVRRDASFRARRDVPDGVRSPAVTVLHLPPTTWAQKKRLTPAQRAKAYRATVPVWARRGVGGAS